MVHLLTWHNNFEKSQDKLFQNIDSKLQVLEIMISSRPLFSLNKGFLVQYKQEEEI